MENILFKKSYQHNNFKKIKYDDLWNKNGIFTTIHVIGKPRKFLLLEEHLKKLNQSLKLYFFDYKFDNIFFKIVINSFFKNNIYYDHLFRIAINKNKISFSLRKREKMKNNFIGILITYQRSQYQLKHLKYVKILKYLNKINSNFEEVILTKKNYIYEGATTNILFVKKNTIYIPKNGYYFGVTLNFLLKHSKRKIIKKNIEKNKLHQYEEILLVGSGKGVVFVEKIPQINWRMRKNAVFIEFHRKYKSYINNEIAT